MLNNIQNDDIIKNNSVTQQSKLTGVDKQTSRNPYLKIAEFGDVIEISEKAKELYEKEKEVEKYKSMVMKALNFDLEVEQKDAVSESLNSDYINDEALAEKMLDNNMNFEGKELLDVLFSESEELTENAFSDLLDT